jgi:phospholipid/cholesterol/gamma-HCH transport system substrate-binding protein
MPSPQRVRWAKLRIFVVVMSALSILSVLVYLLGGDTWFKPKTYLTAYIPDATGVDPGADVQLNGVLIGKVEWVQLTHSTDPNKVVEVRLRIGEQYRSYIPDDSVTEIDSTNMLGDTYIDILMGESQRPVQAAGVLAFRPPSTMIPKTSDLRQFDAQLKSIDQTIIDMQGGKGPLGQFVVGDALYQRFLDGVVNVEKQMHAATASQSQLGQALYSTAMIDNVSGTLRQLDDRLAKLQSSPWLRDTTEHDKIRGQIEQVRRTLADLHEGKGAGGQFIASDADYAAWNRLLAGWIQSVDTLNSGEGSMGQMVTNAQTYESLNGELRELENTIKQFRANPRKYLRIRSKLF